MRKIGEKPITPRFWSCAKHKQNILIGMAGKNENIERYNNQSAPHERVV